MTSGFRAPNFFIPGTQKAGTTFLNRHLKVRHEIFLSRNKEPHFFSGRSGRVDDDTYRAYLDEHFSEAGSQRWRGEASALYLTHPAVPGRIAELVGRDVRFIICLREPVSKAISLYMHNLRKGRLKGTEPLAYKTNDETPSVKQSLYSDGVKRYFDAFGREQSIVLLFEDLERDPNAFLGKALKHLDLEFGEEVEGDRVNAGQPLIVEGDHVTPAKPYSINGREVRPRLPLEEIYALQKRLVPDVSRLEEIIDLDLTHWKTATFD